MKKKSIFKSIPKDWQMNSKHVTTAEVQFWSAGVMSSRMPLDQARTLVDNKQAFVIADNSIGLLTNGRMDS
jgi:hypothetical protein